MSEKIVFGQETKNKLKEGINKVADAVSVSMGPFGRNVLYKDEYGNVRSTKDGVSIAKMIKSIDNPIEDFGAQIVKQAALQTLQQAGDGTTTSTVLAQSMAIKALEASSYSSTNTTEIKRGMEEATKEVISFLKASSVDVTSETQIQQIATLSSNGDKEIGALVSEAMKKVGRDGIITVEESKSGETSLEIVEGLQFDRGYKSPYFATNNDTMSVMLDNPYILLYDKKIGVMKDILPLLEHVSTNNKSLLIIAEDIEGEALGVLLMNKGRGVLKVCAVKAPDFGDRRQHILEDIATITGGTVISPDKGMSLAKFDMSWLGESRVVTVDRDTTTIVDGKGNEDKIQERIINLKNQIDKPGISPYDIERLQERLGKMVGGVAIINIGGNNEIEMKEKKDRLEDSLNATKSAIEEGILPGAGVALLAARKKITFDKSNSIDFNKGKEIVYEACSQPLEVILNNAGEKKFTYLLELEKSKNVNHVPKIGSNKLVDAFDEGIIDPTKVVRVALQNALGVATTLILTECVIYSEKEKKEENINPMDFM